MRNIIGRLGYILNELTTEDDIFPDIASFGLLPDMNIGFIHNLSVVPHRGGLERVTYLLAKEFAGRGHSVVFLSTGEPEERNDFTEFPQSNIPVMSVSAAQLKNKLRDYIRSNALDLLIIQDLYKENLRVLDFLEDDIFKVDVHHNQPFSVLGKERRVKRNVANDSLTLKGKLLKYLAIGLPRIYRALYLRQRSGVYLRMMDRVDRFILLSERYRQRLLAPLPGIDDNKVISINNPITFPRGETAYQEKHKKNIVLVVCRLTDPQKNLTGFIDVWKKFSLLQPDWEAVVVGSGEDEKRIKDYAIRKGVERLRFEGSRTNVADYYRSAKIFCMTSHYEGWPMTLMEAMAFGCVPVAYDGFEAIHDIIEDGRDGIIVPGFDPGAMVSALNSLAADREQLAKMAQKAVEAVDDFTVEKIADEWEEKVFSMIPTKKDII